MADARVGKLLLLDLHGQVVGAEIGRDVQLVAELFAHEIDLLGRNVGAAVHLARLEAPDAVGPVLERACS